MNFSIIIPAHNEGPNIGPCIGSIFKNRVEGAEFEVMVIDDGSTDQTVAVAEKAGARVLHKDKATMKTIAGLRNYGARISGGDILVFLDADMVVPENWLATAKLHFDRGFKGVLGFVDRAPDQAGIVGRAWGQRLYIKRDRIMDVDYLPGRNLFINRSVFEDINGFDASLTTAEDKDITLRVVAAGYRALSSPETALIHLGYEKNFGEFVRKEFWRQGSTVNLMKKLGLSVRTLRHPLLCLFHLILPLLFLFCIISQNWVGVFISLFAWFLPSFLLTARDIGLKWAHGMFPVIVFLTLVRWNVAGIALIQQLVFRKSGPDVDPGNGPDTV